jgi:hypothetical protein
MTRVLSYQEVIETYDIGLLKAPGDLQLTADGDIAVHDGDLKLGNDQYNAMFRFVQAWRFNSPTLEGLFGLVAASAQAQDRLNDELSNVMSRCFATKWSEGSVTNYHAINDLLGANEIGEAACAGALFIILNNLLMRLKADLSVKRVRWTTCEPLIKSASFGSLVSAAANNFRHHDEWRRAKKLTQQQRLSMNVLSLVLDSGIQLIRENVCAKLLSVISVGRYEQLTQMLFEFAKNLSSGCPCVPSDCT